VNWFGRTPRIWHLGFWICVAAAGCDLPGRPKPADRFVPPHEEMRFTVLFDQNCVGCHGAEGKLGPAPPLNDELFLTIIPPEELLRIVSQGREGTLMPAFGAGKGGGLTSEQVRVLTEGIRQRWGSAAPTPIKVPPYLLPETKPSATAVDAGTRVFARACASCHGESGHGGRYGGKPDGRPVGAINVPGFLALISDQALRRLIITGRPDLGMPNYAESHGRPADFKPLTSQDVTDVVALLASWRQGTSINARGN
jgi:mono/diheme cytochrome c family protein